MVTADVFAIINASISNTIMELIRPEFIIYAASGNSLQKGI
jgi:hypothetical protein